TGGIASKVRKNLRDENSDGGDRNHGAWTGAFALCTERLDEFPPAQPRERRFYDQKKHTQKCPRGIESCRNMGEIAQVHLPKCVPQARGSDRQLQNEETEVPKARRSCRAGGFRVAPRQHLFPFRDDPARRSPCGSVLMPR